jgi:hypothetical protein
MKIEALDGIDLSFPRGVHEHSARIAIAGRPSRADAFAAEVDILGVVLSFERRGEEPDNIYARQASMTRHFAHEVGLTFAVRQTHGELGDDTPQAVNLLLPPDVADGAA